MAEEKKDILDQIEDAIKTGKVSDVDLGVILGICITSVGNAACQQ